MGWQFKILICIVNVHPGINSGLNLEHSYRECISGCHDYCLYSPLKFIMVHLSVFVDWFWYGFGHLASGNSRLVLVTGATGPQEGGRLGGRCVWTFRTCFTASVYYKRYTRPPIRWGYPLKLCCPQPCASVVNSLLLYCSMHCKCGYHFCWRCMKAWSPIHTDFFVCKSEVSHSSVILSASLGYVSIVQMGLEHSTYNIV